MIRFIFLCALLWGVVTGAAITEPAAPKAQVLTSESGMSKGWFGRRVLTLTLSAGVPFRVFTLASPSRLVMDFRDLDLADLTATPFVSGGAGVSAVRFGAMEPGWTRIVADLSAPLQPQEVGMDIDARTGKAVLRVAMAPVTQAEFADAAGTVHHAHWPGLTVPGITAPPEDRFVVVIDPGHGGIDPGAERAGLSEKVLMLDIALELRDLLAQKPNLEVMLTRESDVFVSLERRVARAHQVGADVFVSLHADALSDGGAQGATIYTLSDEASDTASAYLAMRHNRSDILAGIDLTGSDDEVTAVLLDLARQETDPRSRALARNLAKSMSDAGGPMNRRPLRHAGFSVLKSADIPSVLIEVGFLSSTRDLENLRDPGWRSTITGAIAEALLSWRDTDAVMRAQMRH